MPPERTWGGRAGSPLPADLAARLAASTGDEGRCKAGPRSRSSGHRFLKDAVEKHLESARAGSATQGMRKAGESPDQAGTQRARWRDSSGSHRQGPRTPQRAPGPDTRGRRAAAGARSPELSPPEGPWGDGNSTMAVWPWHPAGRRVGTERACHSRGGTGRALGGHTSGHTRPRRSLKTESHSRGSCQGGRGGAGVGKGKGGSPGELNP